MLAMALADGERAAALTFVGLFRGLLIQTAYRSVAGGLMSQDRHAVLLWSHVGSLGPLPATQRVSAFARCVLGTAVAVIFEFGIKLVSNVLLAAPLHLVLYLIGASWQTQWLVNVAIFAARMLVTLARAAQAYFLDRQRRRDMPATTANCWRIDYMGALPAGSGYGGGLLRAFVSKSDAAGATVYLVCTPDRYSFYRRHGFHRAPTGQAIEERGLVLMRRVPPSICVPRPRRVPSASSSRAEEAVPKRPLVHGRSR
ncbi:MAG: hypothetical protein M3Z02_13290 [Actinomycetota bacterium]|nr:hypothetical protein [Actinomycetota bacterium]